MAATLDDVRTALAGAFSNAGLHGYAQWPAKPTFPAAIVEDVSGGEAEALAGGLYGYRAKVVILVAQGSLELAQQSVDTYLSAHGAASLDQALKADPTLSGVVDCAVLDRIHDAGLIVANDHEYTGALADIEVWTA